MRVLFVDDDRNILSALSRALRGTEHTILVAESAETALLMLEGEDVDVIVSDDRMPGMSGTQLLQEAREKKPDVLRILLTGHADLETAMRAINEGAVFRFLTKPCRADALVAALRDACEQRELLLENRRLIDTLDRRRREVRDLQSGASGLRDVIKDEGGAIVIGNVLDDLGSIVEEMEKEVEQAESRLRARETAFGRRKAA